MKPAVKFLLILAIVALVVCIGINVMLGPPGLSAGYRAQYKADHDHYLEIIKSNAYKLYVQRPELNGPGQEGVPAALEANIAFADEYVARPAFVKEQKRIALYGMLFDFFNAGLVLIIILRFARRPLLDFLDTKIAELREKMDAARDARLDAEKRKKEADARMAAMPEESKRVAQETKARIERELATLEEANQHSMQLMERALADRKQEEVNAAAMLVKRELVNNAIDNLAAQYRARLEADDGRNHQTDLIDGFAGNLETLS